MNPLRLLSPSGRLSPRAFVAAIIVVYIAIIASQWLTTPDVLAHGGLWSYVAAQTVLIWIWFVLHAKRLHDAGYGAGLAVGVAILYILAQALLIIVVVAFFNATVGEISDPNAAGALGLLLVVAIVGALLGAPQHDFAWAMVTILTFMTFAPPIVAIVCTLWTATRLRAEERAL
jgi:uncharacterized membrane protein YhaH (DUF805 family)